MRSGEETDLPFTQRLMKSNKNHTVCLLNPEYSQAPCRLPAGKGLTEIGISRTLSPRWNTARWRVGRKSFFGSVGSLRRISNGY
jgi:hypothetical protein